MKQPVIVDCVRTPIGRSHPKRGALRNVRSDELAVTVVRALLERTGIDPAEIEDVLLGTTQQHGEQGVNVARIVGLVAGLPASAAGATINRLCGSSLQTVHQAAQSIVAGCEDVQIAGGLEHMDHVPMESEFNVHPRYFDHTTHESLSMGITNERLAERRGITRQQQDEYALESHRKAAEAAEAGGFDREIVPVPTVDAKGREKLVERDQCIRPDTSLEKLAELQPAFVPGGTVTAGNSSPLSDGAAALLVMSDEKARALGLKPWARVVSMAVAGIEPELMGLGPVAATRKALQRAGMTVGDLDLIELNEAFAAQALSCAQELEFPREKMNLRGGSLALGHPLGASGARIATTLLHLLRDRDATVGLATMCIGLGQGIATIFERLD